MTYSGQTMLGIIGRNISHTLSPALHTEAIHVLRIPYTYGVFDVDAGMLPGVLNALRTEHVRGVNVTIPHKQAVIPLLDKLSVEARTLGAVNTIVNNNGVLSGENTDVDGVRASLLAYAPRIHGRLVLVLGAGGASRAVAYTLAEFRAQEIIIHNRHQNRAQNMIAELQDVFPAVRFRTIDNNMLTHAINDATLIVNATSVGMQPESSAMPVPDHIRFSNEQIIFDIIYSRERTALLRKADADGATAINGMEMFIQQGARAFTLWTGLPFPVREARERVYRELGKR